MSQDRYVLIHQDGQFLSINDGNHWICVPDSSAATVLSETKANNILQNMIKPRERENWRLHPLAALAGGEQPVVEDIPQEEVPAFEEAPAPTPRKQPRQRRKKAAAEPSAKEAAGKDAAAKDAAEPPAEQAPEEAPVQNAPAAEAAPSRKKSRAGREARSEQPARVVPARARREQPVREKEPQEDPHALVSEWMERADAMKKEYERLIQRKKDLAEQLRQVSAELCDLEHYIEFHSLNAVKGYRIYRQLRDCLIRRRKIKDELMCITIFLKAEPHNIMNGNLVRQFSGLRTREYSPRVLQELFEEEKEQS